MNTFLTSLYVWFYALPIMDILHLVAFLTFLFLLLRERYGALRRWRAACGGGLTVWLAAALWITLGNRSAEVWQEPALVPFWSYFAALSGGQRELLRSNFMNTLLFYPAGLLAGAVLPRRWRMWQKVLLIFLLCCALSVAIELAQYYARLGLAETDDVIHNTLGGVIGVLASQIPMQLKSTDP